MLAWNLSTINALARQHRLFEWTLARALVAGGVPVSHLDLVELRATSRADRLACRTSQRWVAGYPALVAEWHPTRNGELFPDQVSFGSHARIWWKCAAGPDHEWQARPNHRTSGRGCPFCAGLRVSVTNALSTVRPDLSALFHPTRNGALTPATITAHTHRSVWWRCARDPAHQWSSPPSHTTGCPFCDGKRVLRRESVAALRPELMTEWKSTNETPDPEALRPGSTKLARWRCQVCGHEWAARVRYRAVRGQGCPRCARLSSKSP